MDQGKDLAAGDEQLQNANSEQTASRLLLMSDGVRQDSDPDRQAGCRGDLDSSDADGCSEDVNTDQGQGIICRQGAPVDGQVMAAAPPSDGTPRRDKVKVEPSGGVQRVCYDLVVDGSRPDVPENDVYGFGDESQNGGSDELNEVTEMTSDTDPVPIYCVVCRDWRQQTSKYDNRRYFRSSWRMLTRTSSRPEAVTTELSGGAKRGVLLTDWPTGGAGLCCCLADNWYCYGLHSSGLLYCLRTRCTRVHPVVNKWPGEISGITASCCHGNTSSVSDGLRSPSNRSDAHLSDPAMWTLFLTNHDSDRQPYSSAHSPTCVRRPCTDYRSDGSDDIRHDSDQSRVYADGEFAGELPLHRLAQGHVFARDLITDLYLAYYCSLKVPSQMFSMTSYGVENTDIASARPLEACIHRGLRQVATLCRGDRDSAHSACADPRSSGNNVSLTNRSSDSAYCSLERHVTSFLYQPLAVCGGHVTRDDLDSDGEMEEDSGTEECSSSDTDVTFVMDPATYTREKR